MNQPVALGARRFTVEGVPRWQQIVKRETVAGCAVWNARRDHLGDWVLVRGNGQWGLTPA